MALVIDADDDERFDAESSALLDAFEEWLRDGGDTSSPNDVCAHASLLLDWRWQYGDGALDRWHTGDIVEFLLEWCPRKLSVGPGDYEEIPQSVGWFMAFLGATQRLAPGSSPPEELEAAPRALADDFAAEMANPANFGMAKSLFAAASADGVDMTDEAAFQRWIDDFNTWPVEERRQLARSVSIRPPARPDPARFAGASPIELLRGLVAEKVRCIGDEVEVWMRGREASQTVRALAAAAVELDAPAYATMAMSVMTHIDDDLAETEIRGLMSMPSARGIARWWLVDAGFEDDDFLYEPSDPQGFVDTLACVLIARGPDALFAVLDLAGDHDGQRAVLSQMWRSPSPVTPLVLSVIGDTHPAKVVAKAARKAAFQHRSLYGG